MKGLSRLPHTSALAFSLLTIGQGSQSIAQTCFNAGDLAQRGVTERIMRVCREEFNIRLDYNKVHARSKQVDIPVWADCFNSCRSYETSSQCVSRFSNKLADGWLNNNRSNIPQICNNADFRLGATPAPSTPANPTARAESVPSQSTKRAEAVLTGHNDNVTGVAWSPDGTKLASSSWDFTARIWDVAARKALLVLKGHGERLTAVAFSPDGARIATASIDQTVRTWDARTGAPGKVLKSGSPSFRASTGAFHSVAFSPDGKWIVGGSLSGEVVIWDAQSGALLKSYSCSGMVTGLSVSADAKKVICVTSGSGSGVRSIDIATGKRSELKGHTHNLNGVSRFFSGGRMATASDDYTVRVWNVATGALLHTLSGHREPVAAVDATSDGSLLASASGGLCIQQTSKVIRIWDAPHQRLKATLAGHDRSVLAVAFTAKGDRLASGSCDNTVRIWNTGALK